MRTAAIVWAALILTACASSAPTGSERIDSEATQREPSGCVGLPVVTEGGELGAPPPLHCPQ